MADVEVVPIEQQNERVSYLVHQNIKHGETSKSLCGWMNCEADVWWKIHFQRHINYFSTDSDRISPQMLPNSPFFRAAKTKANWQVTIAHGHLKKRKAWNHKYMLTHLHLCAGASHTVCHTFQNLLYVLWVRLWAPGQIKLWRSSEESDCSSPSRGARRGGSGICLGCLPGEAFRKHPNCKTEAMLEELAWECPGITLLEGGLGLFA